MKMSEAEQLMPNAPAPQRPPHSNGACPTRLAGTFLRFLSHSIIRTTATSSCCCFLATKSSRRSNSSESANPATNTENSGGTCDAYTVCRPRVLERSTSTDSASKIRADSKSLHTHTHTHNGCSHGNLSENRQVSNGATNNFRTILKTNTMEFDDDNDDDHDHQ